jgi:hypothetical protein
MEWGKRLEEAIYTLCHLQAFKSIDTPDERDIAAAIYLLNGVLTRHRSLNTSMLGAE